MKKAESVTERRTRAAHLPFMSWPGSLKNLLDWPVDGGELRGGGGELTGKAAAAS
ncbi:hypothetical protein [Actinoplanes palleronii]|uniref:Uncharacterized protein n=1 Tax=Actinoplanes palleronii TaxID=113570 RepID=A0ABQ4BQM6_9ACTN|nr:hypothetical protein [Actinoplanes palleronii]GIE72962.1 hypothetical protein Apa02nite_090700 [Actinoplanes palleronii]